MAKHREWLYIVSVALPATHQVDAVFWREWDVFGVAMHVLGVGLVAVASRHPRARASTLACAATGVFTCALHAFFLTRYATAFWAPASLAILAATLVTSLALAASAARP